MLLDEQQIEQRMSAGTGCSVAVAIVDEQADERVLFEGERARAYALRETPRLDSWLRGRAALKSLLHRLGESTDTAVLSFPHPRFSLSHSGRYAVAVAVDACSGRTGAGSSDDVPLPLRGRVPVGGSASKPLCEAAACEGVVGVGVDLELGKAPKEASARFFLTAPEQEALGEGRCGLLRLWTVKEALFKADPNNGGRTLLDYRVLLPAGLGGWAEATLDSRLAMRYATIVLPAGFLTVAISLADGGRRGGD